MEKQLTIEQYKVEADKWFNRHEEYLEKLVAINKKEKEIIATKFQGDSNNYLNSSDANDLEQEQIALKKEFTGYIDPYFESTFYCMLQTEQDIDAAVNFENTKTWLKKDIKNINKLMTDGHTIGIFEGIACALDDFYYLLRDNKTNELVWVGRIDEISENN